MPWMPTIALSLRQGLVQQPADWLLARNGQTNVLVSAVKLREEVRADRHIMNGA